MKHISDAERRYHSNIAVLENLSDWLQDGFPDSDGVSLETLTEFIRSYNDFVSSAGIAICNIFRELDIKLVSNEEKEGAGV